MTRLSELVDTSERVGSTSSRRAKATELADLLRRLAADEIDVAVDYLAGRTPQGRIGLGYALIDGARTEAATAPGLELLDVDRALGELAQMSGAGSAAARTARLSALFGAATAREQSFVVRLLIGELRQGALEGLMIDAVALAASLPVADVRRAAMVTGGIAAVARAALVAGAAGLLPFSIELFQPLAPMLAQPADDVADALVRIPDASIEWKLDGARVQVHKSGHQVRVYTRAGNEVTTSVTEVVEAVQALEAPALILDGEVIALRPDGSPYPFQDTMRRFGSAPDDDRMRIMPLSVFFFDCLRVGDQDLVGQPGALRYTRLRDTVAPSMLIPRLAAPDLAAAQAFYDDTVARRHEGVMVKAVDAPYEPGRRSAAWLKVKRAHTLDLVVIAAEWGHGRRHGWLSNLHLAARDVAGNGFVMLGKTFKGMTDELLRWQTAELTARALVRQSWGVQVRPELVVEVTFNDLQASPRYPAGLALRFARIKRYRPDKTADAADTIDTVREIYASQAAPRQGE